MLPREMDGREANGWLPLAQRAVTLHFVKFPYPVDHEIPLFLAPMAGVSEAPFRQVCRGADVVVSEFLSAVGIKLVPNRIKIADEVWNRKSSSNQ